MTASTNGAQTAQAARKPNGATERFKLTPSNAAAGVKRRSEEPEAGPRAKQVKIEQNGIPSRPVAVPSGRFQLTAKSSPARTLSPAGQRSTNTASSSTNPARAVPKQPPKQGATGTPTPPGTSDGSAKPKKGFASILEKAKAAQAAATASSSGGIKHKPVEKLTRKERLRLQEEARAAQKAGRKLPPGDRSRSGTPAGPAVIKKVVPETAYKGTMKKAAPEPLGYKGTMKAGGISDPKKAAAKKGQPQDKYGGYASWSDLDDAEDEEEEEGYGYDDSDEDMEAGLDDLEAEESAALRAARREDQEALEEEERLRREKAERKRKLLALSKSAAARKKF